MVSGTRSLREQLVESIQDKEYRDALVEETISQSIAFQIRANRARRDWTQAELGRRAAKPQSEVSRLEDPDYEGYTLKTLMRLASAFDVGLAVRFVPFSAIVDDMANEKTRTFEVPAFSEDPGLKPKRDSGFQMSMAIFPFTAATNAIPETNVISMAPFRKEYHPEFGSAKSAISAPEEYRWQTTALR